MPEHPSATGAGTPARWNTFLDTPPEEADPSIARVSVIPVPYDATASYRSGARHGPRAIIEASAHLEDYDLELDRDISVIGIHTGPEIEPDMRGPEAMIDRVCSAVLERVDGGKLVAILGGEHTVTVGAVRAMASVYADLSVLFLDAHADLRDTYMGTGWGHASVARRICDLCPVVHVGVRSISAEERRFAGDKQLPIVYWPPGDGGPAAVADQVLASLTSRVYVSVDLDVFDPSIMAAVGNPEPGGMTWPEVTGLLRSVAEQREIVGFDVAELSPAEGPEACAFTAAKLAYKLMGYATERQ